MIRKDDLISYEMPWYAGLVGGSSWIGKLLVKYVAWKINYKWKRYVRRQEMIAHEMSRELDEE